MYSTDNNVLAGLINKHVDEKAKERKKSREQLLCVGAIVLPFVIFFSVLFLTSCKDPEIPSVAPVCVETVSGEELCGSCFFTERDELKMSWHVAQESANGEIMVVLEGRSPITSDVVPADNGQDIARALFAADIADSICPVCEAGPEVGDRVTMLKGMPNGVSEKLEGIVTNVFYYHYEVNVASDPGYSGGPVVRGGDDPCVYGVIRGNNNGLTIVEQYNLSMGGQFE